MKKRLKIAEQELSKACNQCWELETPVQQTQDNGRPSSSPTCAVSTCLQRETAAEFVSLEDDRLVDCFTEDGLVDSFTDDSKDWPLWGR